MSAKLSSTDILFAQRILACGGFYKGKLDGDYGPLTRKAEEAADAEYRSLIVGNGFDRRSEKNIATLLPDMQVKARAIMNIAARMQKKTGISCVILSGTRTYAEQNALYGRGRNIKTEKDSKGRTVKVSVVTNALAGSSNHNFGIALDVGLFKDGRYLTGAGKGDDQAYRELAAEVKKTVTKIAWGGDWRRFKDLPHYELSLGLTLAQVRAQFEKGKLTC
jgi:peptidoglycan L-alanyl-D-glutamate endopeptidase CwlK